VATGTNGKQAGFISGVEMLAKGICVKQLSTTGNQDRVFGEIGGERAEEGLSKKIGKFWFGQRKRSFVMDKAGKISHFVSGGTENQMVVGAKVKNLLYLGVHQY